MTGIATCPFCNVINRFYENERRCPHYQFSVTEDSRYPWKKGDKCYAVFREEQEEIKVLIEEESSEG